MYGTIMQVFMSNPGDDSSAKPNDVECKLQGKLCSPFTIQVLVLQCVDKRGVCYSDSLLGSVQ